MASKKLVPKAKLLATLVSDQRQPCAFCHRDQDDETTFGKLYAIGDIQVHYFCALLSCCLVQKGRDTEGLFGFLYPDIVAEVERSKKHKCSYCHLEGASIGCTVAQCRKQFHLPCGREKNAMSLFYGNYKSFCQQHAPKQKIPEHIMAQARLRMKQAKNALKDRHSVTSSIGICAEAREATPLSTDVVCVICYESVCGFPSPDTFWPPCCARDAWFHRPCLQRMALSAGMHYLKCPLCNDKDQFYWSVVNQGLYVPDRDAAWELEQGAFAEIYERPTECSADQCLCPLGRATNEDKGAWDIQMCLLCGTMGCHVGCARGRFVCAVCCACAPSDGDLCALADKIEQVIQLEERQRGSAARRLVMPSRMSLRRTKAAAGGKPSTSQLGNSFEAKYSASGHNDSTSETTAARLELNLTAPRKRQTRTKAYQENILKSIDNNMFSPTKLVEEGLSERIGKLGFKFVSPTKAVTKVREKLTKPRPLCVKKKIVGSVLDKILLEILNENQNFHEEGSSNKSENSQENIENGNLNPVPCKNTAESLIGEDDSSSSTFQLPSEFIADHNSDDSLSLLETPKKLTTVDIQKDSSLEISEKDEGVNIDVVQIKDSSDNKEIIKGLQLKFPLKTEKCAFKFNSTDKESLVENNLDMDVESFKDFYLNEVDREAKREFNCTYNHKHIENPCKSTKLRSAIDFALEATKTKEEKRKMLKRKLQNDDDITKNKPKKDKALILKCKKDNYRNIKVMCRSNNENITESVDVIVNANKETKDTKMTRRKAKKNKRLKENINRSIDLTVETSKTTLNRPNTKISRMKAKKNKRHEENISSSIDVTVKTGNTTLHRPDTKITRKKAKKNTRHKENISSSIDVTVKTATNTLDTKTGHEKTKKNKRLTDNINRSIDLTVQTAKTKRRLKNIKKKNIKGRENIQVKIRFREERVRLKITNSQAKNKKIKKRKLKQLMNTKKLKQCILQYGNNFSSNQVIVKPDHDVTPKKRNYVKLEKSPDALVQTSIQSFFKIVPTKKS